MKIDICLASDDNYIMYMGTAIASILKNSEDDDELVFHIIDAGISNNNLEKLLLLKSIKYFEIKFYEYDFTLSLKWFNKMKNKSHFSKAMFYRLLIPKIIKTVDKILYLDCDIIVNKSLNYLFNIDMENNYLVVSDRSNKIKTTQSMIEEKKILKLEDKDTYFNSGVLLINNKLWIENNIFISFNNFVDNEEYLIFGDQHILNCVFKDRLKVIDEKYNFCSHKKCYESDKLPNLEEITILHYITNEKPWKEYCPNLHFVNEYWKYYILTPWFKDNPVAAIDIIIKQNLNYYKLENGNSFQNIYRLLEDTNNRLEDTNIRLNDEMRAALEETRYNINWIKIFGIYNNKNYIKIVLFGLSFTFRMNEYKINKIAWWIPVKKWRDNFRNKF